MFNQFGESEADLYVAALKRYIKAIVERPERGEPAGAAPTLLVIRAVRHHIFYKVLPEEIRIIRILHEQNPAMHRFPQIPDALLSPS